MYRETIREYDDKRTMSPTFLNSGPIFSVVGLMTEAELE